jgi:phosphoglycerate kinase
VLMTHLGRPHGADEKYSTKHIITAVERELGRPVVFGGDCIGANAFAVTTALKPGEVVLLENVRYYKEETKGNVEFAEKLSKHGDVYVNDAFGTAHRAHASTTIVAQFFPNDKMFGFLLEKEIESVNRVLNNSRKPVVAIVGGAKVSSKIGIIASLLDKIDTLIIGGGMVYTFVKARGGQIGNSLVEEEHLQTALDILDQAEQKGVRVMLPEDTLAADAFSNDAKTIICPSHEIPEGYMGVDIGPAATGHFETCIETAQTILWNGPVGVFEMPSFETGTRKVANSIVKATECGAFSLVGGGDSVAAINKYELGSHVSHVSTGGGAMLEFLEGQVLPGIAAILN